MLYTNIYIQKICVFVNINDHQPIKLSLCENDTRLNACENANEYVTEHIRFYFPTSLIYFTSCLRCFIVPSSTLSSFCFLVKFYFCVRFYSFSISLYISHICFLFFFFSLFFRRHDDREPRGDHIDYVYGDLCVAELLNALLIHNVFNVCLNFWPMLAIFFSFLLLLLLFL